MKEIRMKHKRYLISFLVTILALASVFPVIAAPEKPSDFGPVELIPGARLFYNDGGTFNPYWYMTCTKTPDQFPTFDCQFYWQGYSGDYEYQYSHTVSAVSCLPEDADIPEVCGDIDSVWVGSTQGKYLQGINFVTYLPLILNR